MSSSAVRPTHSHGLATFYATSPMIRNLSSVLARADSLTGMPPIKLAAGEGLFHGSPSSALTARKRRLTNTHMGAPRKTVRTKLRKQIARRARVATPKATRPNERWSMDFMSARLLDGRWFRVLTVVDQFTRECLALLADNSLNGHKVALALSQLVAERGAPLSITADNGSEFVSKTMDAWSYQHGVQLDFIRPGKPVENSYIESFNGRLRDECLNVEVFFALSDVRDKLERWRQDYNQVRPRAR